MKLVAEGVKIDVSGEERVIDIYVNDGGNLVLSGIGSVVYEMLDEEIYFSDYEKVYGS